MHESSLKALSMLRDPSLFQWYVIPLLAVVFYCYFVEIERRNWNLILAGLAVWGVEVCLEVINALVLYFTDFSAVWTEVGPTAYLILVGVNIETTFMFAMMGLVFCRVVPKDPAVKIFGIPNRWFFTTLYSCFCVCIEVILNQMGVLVWNYWWWNWPNIWLIVIFGYSLYFVVAFRVMDMKEMRHKVMTVGSIWAVGIVSGVVFIGLGWI